MEKTFTFGRGTNCKGESFLDPDNFLKQFDDILHINIKKALNFVRLALSSIKKSRLKILGDRIPDLLSTKPLNFPYGQWYAVGLDIIDCRVLKIQKPKPKRKYLSNVIHVEFSIKNVELVNLSSMLRDKDVLLSIPSIAKAFTPPTVVYSLNQPIGSKIFNFNKFVGKLAVNSFLEDSSTLPCDCANSPFTDRYHNHVITGDLRIV